MLRRHPGVEIVLGEVTAIDKAARVVTLAEGRTYPFDILVLATGATHSYFGMTNGRGSRPASRPSRMRAGSARACC